MAKGTAQRRKRERAAESLRTAARAYAAGGVTDSYLRGVAIRYAFSVVGELSFLDGGPEALAIAVTGKPCPVSTIEGWRFARLGETGHRCPEGKACLIWDMVRE